MKETENENLLILSLIRQYQNEIKQDIISKYNIINGLYVHMLFSSL